jgi:hypothetical protein
MFHVSTSVLATGLLLLLVEPLGIGALWQSWVVLTKTLLLVLLMGLLSYVHFGLQPKIEAHMPRSVPMRRLQRILPPH